MINDFAVFNLIRDLSRNIIYPIFFLVQQKQ